MTMSPSVNNLNNLTAYEQDLSFALSTLAHEALARKEAANKTEHRLEGVIIEVTARRGPSDWPVVPRLDIRKENVGWAVRSFLVTSESWDNEYGLEMVIEHFAELASEVLDHWDGVSSSD